MDVGKQIKELTISFFKTINAEILNDNEIYTIIIPEKYSNFFQKSKIKIAFDEKLAEENNCELLIPGNKTLFQIINNCNNKGPIVLKKSILGNMNQSIRYHFYVNFSGIKHNSELLSVTVDLEEMKAIELQTTLEVVDSPFDFNLVSEKITPAFDIALKQLKQNSVYMEASFVNEARSLFESDLQTFISRYDDEIRELDDSINKKEESSNDENKIREYRFNTLEKINSVEKEKNSLIESLQEKHKIELNYELVACELILK